MAVFQTYQNETSFTHDAVKFIEDFINQQAKSSLFLSGGSTPGPIYKKLSSKDLGWSNINVGLVDERWVEPDDAGSNEQLIQTTLMQNYGQAAAFFPMKSDHKLASMAKEEVEQHYAPLFQEKSLAVLGMGNDGHTASWFPGATGLRPTLSFTNKTFVQSIMAKPSEVTGSYLERMTLTLFALQSCERILLLTKGAKKLDVLEQAMLAMRKDLPVSYLLSKADEKLTILHLEDL